MNNGTQLNTKLSQLTNEREQAEPAIETTGTEGTERVIDRVLETRTKMIHPLVHSCVEEVTTSTFKDTQRGYDGVEEDKDSQD